jgi:hypothetical protein
MLVKLTPTGSKKKAKGLQIKQINAKKGFGLGIRSNNLNVALKVKASHKSHSFLL